MPMIRASTPVMASMSAGRPKAVAKAKTRLVSVTTPAMASGRSLARPAKTEIKELASKAAAKARALRGRAAGWSTMLTHMAPMATKTAFSTPPSATAASTTAARHSDTEIPVST